MKNRLLKPALAAMSAVITLASLPGFAQNSDSLERKLRELNIMDNIFKAALEADDRNGISMRRVGRPDSMYLAGQGMVFSFRLLNIRPVRKAGQGFNSSWVDYMKDMMATTQESLARVQENFPDLDFDFDYDVDVDKYNSRSVARGGQTAPQAPQQPATQAMDITRIFMGGDRGPEREAMQEMEEAMRDMQEEIRDQQRDIRSMERGMRNAAENDRKAIQAKIDSLEAAIDAQMAGLEEQQQAYDAFVSDLQETRQSQQLAMAEEASGQIINTLCDYGASLRSLDNNEHVTIILEDVMDDTDQVYVFDYKDISDCRSADSLKEKAVSYQLHDM